MADFFFLFFFFSSEEWDGSRGKIGYPFWLVCLWNGLGWAGWYPTSGLPSALYISWCPQWMDVGGMERRDCSASLGPRVWCSTWRSEVELGWFAVEWKESRAPWLFFFFFSPFVSQLFTFGMPCSPFSVLTFSFLFSFFPSLVRLFSISGWAHSNGGWLCIAFGVFCPFLPLLIHRSILFWPFYHGLCTYVG